MRTQPQCKRQEFSEFPLRHFAAGHRKIVVHNLPETADVSGDRQIVGWVGEDRVRLLAFEQALETARVAGIAAEQPVPTELPHVAKLRDGSCGNHWNEVL